MNKNQARDEAEAERLFEERQQRRLLQKMERKAGFFKYWFPKGKVTSYALAHYNEPVAKLFQILMPDMVKAARKEGARYAAKRFLQNPRINAGVLEAWRWDRCYPYAMRKYQHLVDPHCWSSRARYDSEAQRYHGHMRAYFVRVFNARHRKAKVPKLPTPAKP